MGMELGLTFARGKTPAEHKASWMVLREDIKKTIEKTRHAPIDFSLKEAYDCLRDVRIPLNPDSTEDLELFRAFGARSKFAFRGLLMERANRTGGAINTSLFPVVAGDTIINVINTNSLTADDPNIALASQLVSEMPDKLPVSTIPEGYAQSAWREVHEEEEFPSRTAGESYVTIGRKKFGEMVKVTREAIRDDRTGLIMMLAENVGTTHPKERARYIIEKVLDLGTDVYKPSGVATALYSASARDGAPAGNLVTSNGLSSEANIKAARLVLAQMTDKDPGSTDPRRIGAQLRLLLVSEASRDVAMKIVGMPLEYSVGDSDGGGMVLNAVNPYFGLKVMSSYILDENTATTWYCGDPAKQFRLKLSDPYRVERQIASNSDEMFNADLEIKIKVAEEFEVGTIDYRYFLKNTQ